MYPTVAKQGTERAPLIAAAATGEFVLKVQKRLSKMSLHWKNARARMSTDWILKQ
jgi:hypothetical protein